MLEQAHLVQRTQRYKGLIFDMDNTILRSRIDFPAMKADIAATLIEQAVLDRQTRVQEHTVATLLETAKASGRLTDAMNETLWARVADWEREGMRDAGLEEEALELLHELKSRSYALVILTNNARQAAIQALETTRTLALFDHVLGREQMAALKPSPSGVNAILSLYPDWAAADWLSVGDSWIDGHAAMQAGVSFVAYRSKSEEFAKRSIPALGRLERLSELTHFL
ncbi:HAD family hydrolase [Paenibacillus koleovorans]|uniref:HAD family hydrolase n=1 Tax=Paenibacillus koleovorans TaxID=121608 RepID=UPI000FD79502|nr:HAD-IA family hydrolase [Paenibacillus koleovorans]